MNDLGSYLIGLSFLALALFPLFIYLFFQLVVLDWKSKALVDDLEDRGAFKLSYLAENKKSAESVRTEIRNLYGYRRFTWPVLLMVFFNLVGFSIVWDSVRLAFGSADDSTKLYYGAKFLGAAELPMMAFIGVVIFNYGHMLRRLYVWDVTTHVFWNALYRTWVVLSVATVLAVSFAPAAIANVPGASIFTKAHAFYFALGFIVNPVLQSLLQKAQTYFESKRTKVPDLPLSMIQGINFWHEYRLEEEGIENVQNLATCDVINLALSTRYNLHTILDWVDQAVLVHRMGEKALKLREAAFISGAIDMAWASSEHAYDNDEEDEEIAKPLAKTIEADPLYVEVLMNNLYEDAQVALLWDLWQSEEESYKKSDKEQSRERARG